MGEASIQGGSECRMISEETATLRNVELKRRCTNGGAERASSGRVHSSSVNVSTFEWLTPSSVFGHERPM